MVMNPLSRRTRLSMLLGLIALFFIILPVIILYASGWRWQSGVGLVRTGGISVTVPYEDALISLDGRHIGTSRFLNRQFYVDDLIPGAYEVRVEKENYQPWVHTLIVEPQIVSDARAFLIPTSIQLLRILVETSTPSKGSTDSPQTGSLQANSGQAATTTRSVDSRTYNSYLETFGRPFATTTGGAYDISGDEGIFLEKGNIYVRWLNESTSPTSNFCGRPSYCGREFAIEEGRDAATSALYFAGGVVYRTKESGIFIRESTILPAAVSAPIYTKRGAEFRVIDGKLIIKNGMQLYEVLGW